MTQIQVGVRELKSRLSHYLRQVKTGQSVIITERGRPVGRIVPVAQGVDERLEAMAQAGLVQWSGKRLKPVKPVARVSGERTVADLLVAERDRDSGWESQ